MEQCDDLLVVREIMTSHKFDILHIIDTDYCHNMSNQDSVSFPVVV